MNWSELEGEISISGGLNLYHPQKPHCFYVLEQKLEYGEFVPLCCGMYIFFISPDLVSAEKIRTNNQQDTMVLLEELFQKGWSLSDDDQEGEIPKLNPIVKWQLCPKIRSVLPQ